MIVAAVSYLDKAPLPDPETNAHFREGRVFYCPAYRRSASAFRALLNGM